jgi:seryl-tRNA synthetase
MLDLREVVENLDTVRAALARRSAADAALLEPVATLSERRLSILKTSEAKQAERNVASKSMASLDKKSDAFTARREELKILSGEVKRLEAELKEVNAELDGHLAAIPNVPHESVPTGTTEDDNEVVKVWGEPPKQDFAVKDHDVIGTELGLLDFERAAKLSGPRFVVERGLGARLERSLINFMLDLHTREHGYTEIMPPFLIKDSALFGTGQLPKFEDDLFKTSKSDPDKSYDLYLSPTAEVPVTNLHAGEILDGAELPLAYVAYTPCFRSEAGSYGKDTRGMIRQHQFNKVELVRICGPDNSLDQLETLTGHAEQVLERLGLHYRRVNLCTGDLGFAARKTYDLEVWLPGQGKYREISSCSNCSDFQARRAKIRHRAEGQKKPRLCHTLNGSGLAVGRTVIAVLEQYQQADGSVVVPEVLRPYMGVDVIRGIHPE